MSELTVEIETNPDPSTMRPSKALYERGEVTPPVQQEHKEPEMKLRDMVHSTVREQITAAVKKAAEPVSQPTISAIMSQGPAAVAQMFFPSISIPQVGVRRSSSDSDKLLFTFQDVMDVTHPIAKIMRMILATYGVTQAEFDERHRVYAESAGFLNVQVNYNRNNIKKAMVRNRLSYQMFEQIIFSIMGFGLGDLVFKLIEPNTGNLVEFSLVKILEKVQSEYPTSDQVTVDTDKGTYVLPKE